MSTLPQTFNSSFQQAFGQESGFDTNRQDEELLQRLNTERLNQQFPAFQNQMMQQENMLNERSFDLCSDFGNQNKQQQRKP